MNELIILISKMGIIIIGIMASIYVVNSAIESMKEYSKDQSMYNLFMTSIHILISITVLKGLIPLIISFMKEGII